MIRALFALFLLTSASFAQSIVVKSGEHADFSRLVFRAPPQATWQMEGQGTDYTLRLSSDEARFDLREVFTLIPRDRLADLQDAPGELRLKLACACDVSVEQITTGYIVIDIADAAVKTVKPANLPITLPRRAPLLAPTGFAPVARVETFQNTVLEHISKAASQDLLDLAITPTSPPDIPEIEAPAAPDHLHATASVPKTRETRLSVTTAVEDALRKIGDIRDQGGVACYDPKGFAIAGWATPQDFSKTLGLYRKSLFAEFDRPDLSAALKLSRAYVRFALTPEAGVILDAFDVGGKDADILRVMIAVFDGRRLADAHPLLSMTSCDPAVALWAVATGQAGKPTKNAVQGIVAKVSAMPFDLRRMIVPKLLPALERDGYGSAANILRASLDRAAPVAVDPVVTKFLADPTTLSDAQLSAVIAGNSDQSANALGVYVNRQIDRGDVPSGKTQTLVRAYAAQFKGSDMGDELALLDLKISSRKGAYAEAMDGIMTLSTAPRPALLRFHVTEILTRGDDSDHVRLAHQLIGADMLGALADDQITSLGRVIGDAGVPRLALQVIGTRAGNMDMKAKLNATLTPPAATKAVSTLQQQIAPLALQTPIPSVPNLQVADRLLDETAELGALVERLLTTSD